MLFPVSTTISSLVVVALLQCVFAATSFAEATVVKKNAKGAKELGWGEGWALARDHEHRAVAAIASRS